MVGGTRALTTVQSSHGPNSAASHHEGAQVGWEEEGTKSDGVLMWKYSTSQKSGNVWHAW